MPDTNNMINNSSSFSIARLFRISATAFSFLLLSLSLSCHSKEDLALSNACFLGNLKDAQLALAKGANPNARISSSEMTPLMIAACGIEVAQSSFSDDNTPIPASIKGLKSDPLGRVEIIQFLLSHGADPTAKNVGGYGTLFYAINGDLPEACHLLKEAGARPDAIEKSGFTPLHYAVISEKPACLNALVKGLQPNALDAWSTPVNGYNETPLMGASYDGKTECIDILLKAGATLNLSDDKIGPAITRAAMGGHREAVEHLLKAGANIEASGHNGSTPLKKAAFGGYEELVAFLITHGANVNAKDIHGRTPLVEASEKGHTKVVELLLKAKAFIDIADDKGHTALDLAKSSGHQEIVLLLSK